jgi:ribosome-associated heat shock protein Hsp15
MLTERADKFLWAVRLYKTRSKAADACKNNQIFINEGAIKPSGLMKEGIVFKIKYPPVYKVYLIKKILHNRIGAKLAADYIEDITSKEDLETIKMIQENIALQRDRGTGRPTKKDRRDLEDFFN